MVILEQNFKWHLEAFASELFKLLNFHFSASNSVAVSGLEIGFQVILKKNGQKRKSHTPPLSLTND